MPAPRHIIDLVEKFQENFRYYQSTEYNEEQLRHEFLNPFFQELGWDMENTAGKGADRDVRYEKRIKAGAPDFGFYLDGKLQFFVEAKNPSKRVCSDQIAAMQLRTYGWSAKVARSILSDFEEFAIYDTAVRPKGSDQARVARLECIKYTEYIERWDEIAGLFSRDAVLRGSLEKLEKKRAKQAVDDELLEDISHWREALAKMIALRNGSLSEEQVNRAVQDTLDRIIFLRICEDRGIETENRLREISEGVGIYINLLKIFKKGQQRYDSELFNLNTFEQELAIDDNTLSDIISELYFPKSPYKFDAIPAEILGQVYEQFLGKVIRLTEGHHAKVEEKYEVRKAGGVYYTPTYIVEYIVKNTVGRLVDGKSPKDIATLSVLDPACGSGSFLIGAYQYLMDWYRNWYVTHNVEKDAKQKFIYPDANGIWQLTLAERTRILLAHIFGVDIDRQAVEVAKLSLMLKALESPEQRSLFNDRILPDLSSNIKCGNSLIGTDYFSGQLAPDPAEMARINPFDWDGKDGFPEIMKHGGFDAVIGNPPYLAGREWTDELHEQRPYFMSHFSSMSDQYDLYALFIQQGVELMDSNGWLGFITPTTWLNNDHYTELRKSLIEKTEVKLLGDFRDVRVFKDATVLPIVIVLNKQQHPNESAECTVEKFENSNDKRTFETSVTIWNQFPGFVFNLAISKADLPVLKKIESVSNSLSTFCDVRFGVKVYQRGKGKPPQTSKEAELKLFEAKEKESSDFFPYLHGEDVTPWQINTGQSWIKYGSHLAEPRTFDLFEGPRVLVRRIVGSRLILAPTKETLIADQLLHTVKPRTNYETVQFISALLASHLIAYYFRKRYNRTEKTFPEIRVA